jgi:hypothetical protein
MATNLQFIKSAEVTSTTTTLEITDCFNDNYDVYYVAIRNFNSDNSANTIYLRFLDSSNTVINSGSLYSRADLALNSGSSFTEGKDTGSDRINIGTTNADTAGNLNVSVHVFNPFDSGSYTFITYQTTARELEGRKGISSLNQASTIKGLQLKSDNASRNFTQGNISVYGVK